MPNGVGSKPFCSLWLPSNAISCNLITSPVLLHFLPPHHSSLPATADTAWVLPLQSLHAQGSFLLGCSDTHLIPSFTSFSHHLIREDLSDHQYKIAPHRLSVQSLQPLSTLPAPFFFTALTTWHMICLLTYLFMSCSPLLPCHWTVSSMRERALSFGSLLYSQNLQLCHQHQKLNTHCQINE